MNYGDLEEVYGGAFRKRVPIEDQSRKDPLEKPLEETVGPNKKALNKAVQDAMRGANIDETRVAEGFRPIQETAPIQQQRMRAREHFSQSQPAGVFDGYSTEQMDKISRILRLVEQNKTGYERPATQDIFLYILTGVFFLFTFDTFVMLGKSMRGK
jgi:hypothetical protein